MASANASIVPSISSILIRSDNLETYSLVWVDDSVNSNENRNAQQHLRSAINYIRVFENSTECETYIRQSKDDQIVLIASGKLGSVIVPRIHSLRQISSIYIYCSNVSKHQEWASKFPKIRAIVTDSNELVEKIKAVRKRIENSFDEPLSISIFNSISNEERSSTNINGGFLHFQLLIGGLLRLRYSQTSREEFFDLCKKEYQGNYKQLSILEDFKESYIPERALYWYTRHSFLFEILNKALRVQDTDLLFLFRFFIQDLYQQLEKLQREQDQTSIRVYRGQLISKQELDVLKESKGQIISMNSFLSTSLSREKSLSFVSSQHDDLCRVLFEIDADPRLSNEAKPFANISSQSRFINEQEILFMIATIFRLVDIREENEITVIQMELCNGNYGHDVKLFEYMQKESEEYDECLSLGHILRTAGMYNKAEQFYNRMLNELTNDHPLIADLWGSIGLVKKAKGEMEISSQWLIKSFKKYEQMGDRLGVARCLHNLANIHQMKGELHQAINKYNQALNIFQQLFGYQSKSVAHCLNNLGVTYLEQRMFTEAMQCFINAVDIRKIILPNTHPDIARAFNNMGDVYFLNSELDRAFQYYGRALDIFQISLPSEHPSIAQTYYNIGLVYAQKSNYQRSLIFLNRASSIYRNTLLPQHPEVHRCINTIDFVKQEQSRLEKQ
jgi:tetratricopeptide (TPR) repeat protein